MKAIVYSKYGPPEVLSVKDIPRPEPQADEVLVKVYAAEATKADAEMRAFKFSVKWFWLPLRLAMGIFAPRRPVLGIYFAGEIVSVGADVSEYEVGEQIFGGTGLQMGAYAEYMTLPARSTMVPKPSNLSFEEAAALPLGGLNALHFLGLAKIQSGEEILINGAGGSIGQFAVQIAKSMGAVVTAVYADHKATMLDKIGADHFIDYRKDDYTKSGRRWDVIFDMVVGSSFKGAIQSLNPNGRYLLGNPRLANMLRARWTNRKSDKRVSFAFAGETEAELLALKDMAEAGQIKPVLDGVFSMEDAAEAHRRVETEVRVGVVVIGMGAELNSQPA